MLFRRKKIGVGFRLAEMAVILLVPVVLVLFGARLVLNDWWLRYEYSKESFPRDEFGFSSEEREEFGIEGLRYLVGRVELETLVEASHEGERLYSPRELDHMRDVRGLVTLVRRALKVSVLTMVGLGAWLIFRRREKAEVENLLVAGGMISLNFMVIFVLMVTLNWEWFFYQFHKMFFAEGSWLFRETDTLIRLYPERLFVDSTVAVLVFATFGAGLLSVLPLGEKLFGKRKSWLNRLGERIVRILRELKR